LFRPFSVHPILSFFGSPTPGSLCLPPHLPIAQALPQSVSFCALSFPSFAVMGARFRGQSALRA